MIWLPQGIPSAGILGSYVATKAADRAGIGRYGPKNLPEGTSLSQAGTCTF